MKNLLFLLAVAVLLGSGCGSVLDGTRLLSADDMAAALNAIESGNTFKLKTGEYLLEYPVGIDGKENITIDGNGSTLTVNSLDSDVIFVNNCKNVRLINFKATHIEASGPTGCTGNVLHIENSSDVTVENCDLNGSGIVGIAAYRAANLKVINNHIHENSEYSIIYQGSSLILENNRFEDNGHDNVFLFDYVPVGESLSWPPKYHFDTDTQRPGLRMSGNVFN